MSLSNDIKWKAEGTETSQKAQQRKTQSQCKYFVMTPSYFFQNTKIPFKTISFKGDPPNTKQQ